MDTLGVSQQVDSVVVVVASLDARGLSQSKYQSHGSTIVSRHPSRPGILAVSRRRCIKRSGPK